MSNNQMISVPREWLSSVALLQMPLDDLQDQAAEFLAEQHQGEPVAWRGINELGEIVTEWIDGSPPDRMVDLCGNPDSFAKIELAYTHADPAEVERLRKETQSLRKALPNSTTELVDLRDKLETMTADRDNEKAMKAKAREQRDRVTAQLAERGVLLQKVHVDSGFPNLFEELQEEIEAALSASAEPTAPLWHRGDVVHSSSSPGKYWECMEGGSPGVWQEKNSIERPSLPSAEEPSAPKCETCDGHGAVGNILNAEPCPDCNYGAPVELDDRGSLLEALEYALPYLEACVPSPRNGIKADGTIDVNCVDMAKAAIAKARAALERKP